MRSRLTVLLVVLLALAGVAAVSYWPSPRRQALTRLHELGGLYREEPDADGRVLGIVALINRPATDDDLILLRDIRPLHRALLDSTKVTDAGLAHLAGIDELEWVSLCGTAVTDAGMDRLREIPNLRALHLRRTGVTDAGIARLKGHPRLELLVVADTAVTEQGAEELRRATPGLTKIYVDVKRD